MFLFAENFLFLAKNQKIILKKICVFSENFSFYVIRANFKIKFYFYLIISHFHRFKF